MSLDTIYNLVLDGRAKLIQAEVNNALAAGHTAEAILNQACIPAMTEVGRQFEIGDKFVPEMIMSARTMTAATEVLKPLLAAAGVQQIGTVVIGTVAGDLHDIGKNLVAMMLEGVGFRIIDLGTDVAPARFVEAVATHQPDILGMSALLTTTKTSIIRTIEALHAAGLRDRVKVMVGGAPVNQEFADVAGADGYAGDAGAAARLAKTLIGA